MRAKYAAVLGVLGITALGAWWAVRRSSTNRRFQIDDDQAADIIRHARPALEAAYDLQLP